MVGVSWLGLDFVCLMGRVFLGWYSTRQGLMCLAHGHNSDAIEAWTLNRLVSSQALYHCTPILLVLMFVLMLYIPVNNFTVISVMVNELSIPWHVVYYFYTQILYKIWALTCDFQQCGILTSVDSEEPVQPPVKLRNFKWCSISSFAVIEYSSDQQRLWTDCVYAQAGLSLCWSHIPHCWKSHSRL